MKTIRMNHPAEYKPHFQPAFSRIAMFFLLLFCLVASTATDSWAEPIEGIEVTLPVGEVGVEKPFACDPSLYMTQGDSGAGAYNRTMIELNPSSLGALPTPIGNSMNFVFNAAGNIIKGPISINGIAHSFQDGAIYAISEHNRNKYNQGQHIYRIMRSATGTAIRLHDLGMPVTSKSAPNQLAGMYTGGTMVLWDQLESANYQLVGNSGITHTNPMESLMVVSTMYKGVDNPSWSWGNHLFILAVEKLHILNGPPRIIAGPIYVKDPYGNPLSGLYDIAYNPKDNKIYGHNSNNPGKIVQIDLSTAIAIGSSYTWKVTATLLDIPIVTNPQTPFIENVGAAFFNGTDELLLYGIGSGGLGNGVKQDQLFSAAPLTSGPPIVLSSLGVSTGPFGASDGTSCAYAPRFTKTVSPNPATPGSTVTYTYTITNNQYSDFTVSFYDGTFDSHLTVTGVNSTNGTSSYTATPPSATIDNIVVPANSSVTFTVTETVDSAIASPMTVNNQATLTGEKGFPVNTMLSDEPILPGFEDQTPLDIVLPPSITKQALDTPWQAGGTGTFQITVHVPTAIPAGKAIAVKDVIPGGLTLSSGPTITPAGTPFVCVGNTCYLNGPIAAGTSYNITFDVQIAETCNTYTNCADVDVTDAFVRVEQGMTLPVPEFSSMGQSCVEVPVTVSNQCTPAELQIEKTHDPATFTNNGTGTISITVSNTGTGTVFAPIQINDTLPPGLSMQSGPFSTTLGADLACVADSTGQQIQCAYLASLGAGASITFSFQVDIGVDVGADKVCNHAAVIKGCCSEEPNDTTEDCIPISRTEMGRICGHKYDVGHHPLSGWVISASAGGPVYTATTSANGDYCIGPLPQGTYTVHEVIPPIGGGVWTPVSPASGSVASVIVGPTGTTPNGIDFINRKDKIGSTGSVPNIPSGPKLAPITKTHSPHVFSTGSKGTFSIKVTNKGKTLTKGMLKVIDHMPVGLTVRTGKFRADLWSCEGGMVTSSGQDVTCVFNKTLRKNRWSAIKLDTSIAPNDQFPAGVNVIRNCATASVYGAAGVVAAKSQACDKVGINHVDSRAATIPGAVPPATLSSHISIKKTHSPSHFSTGSRGAFKIIVKNKGKKLEKGALTLVDQMPGGLSVRTGTFRAGSWLCHGGMISGSGQNVTCSYNRALNKRGRATLNLNATVAPRGQFPAGVDEVENCATASVQGAAGVKACDRVNIRKVSKSSMPDLAPLDGLIMQIPRGGGGGGAVPVRKTPGAIP